MCYNYTILLLQKMSLAYIISKLFVFLITKRESFFPQVAKKTRIYTFQLNNQTTGHLRGKQFILRVFFFCPLNTQ